jgi:protein tyrosine phosphatase
MPFFAALLPENVDRNRFKDVVPYDENRVRIMPDKVGSTVVSIFRIKCKL